MTSKGVTQISTIAATLTISAVLKIPSIILGLDFQLSTSAVSLMLAFFEIKKYSLGGLLSNLLLLVSGVFNPINVIIFIIFKVITIVVVYLLKTDILSLVLAGVLGSLASRLILSAVLNLPVWVVLLNAIPGVVSTLIVAILSYPILGKRMAVLLK